jgi:short-subunit dehydrogenase
MTERSYTRLYGPCAGFVAVLSVGAASFGRQTGHMATDTLATAFVTGAAGFIGSELVKVLVARRHRVFGLT